MASRREAMQFGGGWEVREVPVPDAAPPVVWVKLGTSIPQDLDTWLNVQAAQRRVTKQALITELLLAARAAQDQG